jgi:hypothetical protein
MKTHLSPSFRIGLRLVLLLLAAIFLGTASSMSAAQSSWKSLPLQISKDGKTATVTVPEGYASVSLQSRQRPSNWKKRSDNWKTVTSQGGVAGSFTFNLTSNSANIEWRALGLYVGGTLSRSKFPANYYKGQKSFGPVKSAAASRLATVRMAYADALPALISSPPPGADLPTIVPEEADIWKVDGNTVYFFNQLRGLQILDLTRPAAPQLTASLRLPAVGQDLYLLPASQEGRTVILLTQVGSWGSGQSTRINQVNVSGGKAQITFTQDVPGYLADSRLAGNRLILATTEWNKSSRLTEWLLSDNQAPAADGETLIEGNSPLISSGPDWLAVTTTPNGLWSVSDVSVFAVRSTGLIPMAQAIRTEGAISNKFRIQWRNNVLTTISESRGADWGWTPKTILENFRAWAPDVLHPAVIEDRLGRLELTEAHGESLYATRFAGDKAYIVTFLQTDPLWVVDLADPQNPIVAGHLEVPGWSSYLQPIGDYLFSIGLESGKIAASLFDVKDPTTPSLLDRVYLGEQWSYSEAIWNDKALKVLPDAGLAMVPLSASYWTSGTAGIQLLDIDLNAGKLRLRGKIAHEFDARRADLIGDAVVSISQRVMEVADISDRDAPAMLAEASLAWPVNRVLEVGNHLFQIEDGQSFGNGRATLRVSPATSSEAILSETDLGDGIVKTAEHRDGKLYVLRQIGSASPWVYWARFMGDAGNQVNQLILDIYDTTAAPSLTLLGTCAVSPKSGAQLASDRLLWPQPTRPAVAINYQYSYGFGIYPIDDIMPMPVALPDVTPTVKTRLGLFSATISKPQPYYPRPYWIPQEAPQLLPFDVSVPSAPVAQAPVDLGPTGSMLNSAIEAADGLVVAGITQWKSPTTGRWLDSSQAAQSLSVLKIAPFGTPITRPAIDLPGELFAISELDANGFLAFTRTNDSQGEKTIQVSACDGFDAFLIASLAEPANTVSTVGGRRIFTTSTDGVERRILKDTGKFTTEPTQQLGWKPDALRWNQGTLTGTKSDSIFAAGANDATANVWDFSTWSFSLDRVSVAADGDLLIPFGDYGVERLDR